MTFKSLSFITLAAAAFLSAAPASAATQSDITTCRAAITAQSNINMEDYRLRFKKEKGNRNRTISLQAISTNGAPGFTFDCYINRGQVPTVKLDQAIKLAKSE